MNDVSELKPGLFSNYKSDVSSGFVVFLVALPLCLGVALASGAPLFSGIIAGIIGGIVVGYFSGSQLGVSGPAAGLAVIVLTSIQELGAFEVFLLAVVISGIFQIVLGILQAGIVGYFFPSSVIKGMLAAIGIVIAAKQLPHAVGYDNVIDGEISFIDHTPVQIGENVVTEILHMLNFINLGALMITLVSVGILLLWDTKFFKSRSIFKMFPGGLAAVVAGIVLSQVFKNIPGMSLSENMFVNLPIPSDVGGIMGLLTFPDFSRILDPKVYTIAFTIALIGSIETLLSVEAADKMDPYKRITPTNKELRAQGIGNIISGFIGGLPITQVIVRSSANVQSGGKSKLSTITHGAILFVAALFLPRILNMVPLASLAAILLLIGYKLAKPTLFKAMFKLGYKQFLPFIVTVVAIVFTDLLTGIIIGMFFGIFNILMSNYRTPFIFDKSDRQGKVLTLRLGQEVSFLNKGALIQALSKVENGCKVVVDASQSETVDYDIIEVVKDFKEQANYREIEVEVIGLGYRSSKDYFKAFVKAIKDPD
jgi:MFS superfamily sulfate permease-like transporter